MREFMLLMIVKKLIVVLGVFVLPALGYFSLYPVFLQKLVTIQVVRNLPSISQAVNLESHNHVARLRLAPRQRISKFATFPLDRYNTTIAEGFGNCSQRSWGYAVRLIDLKQDVFVIDLLNPVNWKFGGGHTILLVTEKPKKWHAGVHSLLLDADEGGILFDGDRPAGFEIVSNKKLSGLMLVDDDGGYLQPFESGVGLSSHSVAVIDSKNIKSYLDFVKSACISFSNPGFEKFVCDGLALFFGKLPVRQMTESDALNLFRGNVGVMRYIAISFVWASRALFFLILLWVIILFSSVLSSYRIRLKTGNC